MTNINLFVSKCLMWVFWNLRICQMWCLLYREMWQKERAVIPLYKNFKELHKQIDQCVWRADAWRELGDATSHPDHVQHLMNRGEMRIGDCDEFGAYEAAAVSNALASQSFEDRNLSDACLMAVMWQDDTWSFGGHNICGLKWVHEDGRIEYGYMDYYMPFRGFNSWSEVARFVTTLYTHADARIIAYARNEPYTMKLLEYKTGAR